MKARVASGPHNDGSVTLIDAADAPPSRAMNSRPIMSGS